MITVVTGNKGKLQEIELVLGPVNSLVFDLEELQSLDCEKVLLHKLQQALPLQTGSMLVEDTVLEIENMGRLPGTMIRWFWEELGPSGLEKMAQCFGSGAAVARTWIAYHSSRRDDFTPIVVKAECQGQIVAPRGSGGFGWDQIFQPIGSQLTFAEMSPAEKQEFSMRRKALDILRSMIQGA